MHVSPIRPRAQSISIEQYSIHVFCQLDVGSERRPYNNDQDDFWPPTKMRCIGFKKHATSTSQLDRFAEKTSTDKVQEKTKGTICKNTTACNSWLMRTFEAWRSNRNKDAPQEEHRSKNHSGGLSDLRNPNKKVTR